MLTSRVPKQSRKIFITKPGAQKYKAESGTTPEKGSSKNKRKNKVVPSHDSTVSENYQQHKKTEERKEQPHNDIPSMATIKSEAKENSDSDSLYFPAKKPCNLSK